MYLGRLSFNFVTLFLLNTVNKRKFKYSFGKAKTSFLFCKFIVQNFLTMVKDLNSVFEELLTRYTKAIENDYKSQYRKAKDKEFIVEELTKGTDFIIEWEEVNSIKEKPLNTFSTMYKRGESITDIVAYIKNTYGNVEDIKPYKLIENGKKITLYLSDEEKALKKLALDERKLLKILIRNTAYKEIKKKLRTLFGDTTSKNETKINSQIIWSGSEKNKNEFVQLIYGLHQAGLINNGKGEVTKLTVQLAEIVGLDLGNNWQSNLSASIHKAKMEYQPPIFDKIKDGYLKYAEKLAYEKKRKK